MTDRAGDEPPAADRGEASAAVSRSAPPDPTTCFTALMPPDAFGNPAPDLSYCCTRSDARSTSLALKADVVRAGGHGVSRAMREWSELGWYETAAFAIMRAQCCPDAAALTVKGRKIAACKLEESLAWLANAIDDPAAMQEAVRGYTRAVRCIFAKGYGESFGQFALPNGNELALVDRILERVAVERRARGH